MVDDGSTDNTSSVASLANAIVIRHEKNRGKGAAIQSILAEVRKKSPDVLSSLMLISSITLMKFLNLSSQSFMTVLISSSAQESNKETKSLATAALGKKYFHIQHASCQGKKLLTRNVDSGHFPQERYQNLN